MLKNKTKKVIALVTLLLILIVPTVSNAFSFTQASSSSSYMTSILNKRYTGINQYKSFLQDLFLFNKGINTSSDVNTVKIQILDKIAKLQSKYNDSAAISNISSKIANTVINDSSSSSSTLISSITTLISSLSNRLNISIESLTPDVVVDDMYATTAGRLCGDKYNVQLSGKIYYANTDSNGKPTSNKWVVLVHGFQMNGQAMADAVGQMYLDQGINVLAPDLRGFGNSKGSVGMGYLESLDIWDWLTYLNNQYSTKCNEVFVHGVSLGGATTVFLSGLEVDEKTLSDKHVIGLIEDCGYTSMTGIVSDMLDQYSDNALVEKILGIFGKASLKDVVDEATIKKLIMEKVDVGLTAKNYDTLSNNLNSLAKCTLPLMIVHGTKDTTVPYKNSTEIYNAAMQNSNIPYVQRFSAEGENHAFIVLGSQEKAYTSYVKNFIVQSEQIASGKKVDKESAFKPAAQEEKTSAITQLVKALKLIKNMIKK